MTLTVDYLPIANGGSANVESQAQYVTDLGSGGSLQNGYQSGLMKSIQWNKTLRQSSMIAAAVANFIANALNTNVIDDGNVATLTTNLTNAIAATASPVGLIETVVADTYTLGSGDGGKFLLPTSLATFNLTLSAALPLGSRMAVGCAIGFGANIIIPVGITVFGGGLVWTNTTISLSSSATGDQFAILSYVNANLFAIESITTATAVALGILGACASLNVGTGLLSSGGNLTLDRFVSSLTALPSAGATASFAHGLGAVPFATYLLLQNVTADLGYSAGDQVVLQPGVENQATNAYGIATYCDATNVHIVLSSTGGIVICNKGTGVIAAITNANWNIIVKAWL